jgi:uncharacterized protein YktA (UPF0223 family)
LGIRNTVTVDLGLIVKRYLLVGVLTFGLVASVGAFLPENLAFADEDDDKDKHEDDRKKDNEKMSKKDYQAQVMENTGAIEEMYSEFDLLNSIAQAWNSAIEAMDLALQSFEARMTVVETQMEEDKATIESLKIQVDDLSGASGIGASSGIIAMTESYTNTVSHSLASNSMGTLSASCNEGDLAISVEFIVISGNEDTMTIYGEKVTDMKTYSVMADNEDSANSFDIDVSVNCIMATDSDVSKSGIGAGSGGLS